MAHFNHILDFPGFYVKATTPSGLHSPYLFELFQEILDPAKHYYIFDHLDAERERLLRSTKLVQGKDFGAKSVSRPKTIAQFAKGSISSKRKCRMLFRLVLKEQARYIIELGTCLGIMTAHLAAGRNSAVVHTLEGNAGLLEVAQDVADRHGIENITFHAGQFDDLLPGVISSLPEIDLAYIDGNHQKEPTLRYFHQLLLKRSADCIIIADDIRWSAGMQSAWIEMCDHPEVTGSIDFFTWGMLFFRKEFEAPIHLKMMKSRMPPLLF